MILTKWNPKDIKGSFKTLCENTEKYWTTPNREGIGHRKLEPMEYTGGKTIMLVFLEDNARTEGGTAFKPEERGKWFDPPAEGKWKFEPTKELCNLSVDEILDLLDEKWICQHFAQDFDKVIEARNEALDHDSLFDKVSDRKPVRIDADIELERFNTGRNIKKVNDVPDGRGGHFVVYELDKGHTKIEFKAYYPANREPFFAPMTLEVFKVIQSYAYEEKTLNPIIRKKDLAKLIGADTSPNRYKRLPDSIDFLTSASYRKTDRQKKTREWGGSLLSFATEYNTDPKDKDGFYHFETNPHYQKYLQAHILNPDILPKGIQYRQLTFADSGTRRRSLKTKYHALTRDRSVKRLYKIAVKRLLKDIGLTDNELVKRTMEYTARAIDQAVDEMSADWFLVVDQVGINALKGKNPYFTAGQYPLLIGLVGEMKRANLERKEHGGAKGKVLTRQDYYKLKVFLERVADNGKRTPPKHTPKRSDLCKDPEAIKEFFKKNRPKS